MRHTRSTSHALAASLFLISLLAHAAQDAAPRSRERAANAPEITYTVSMTRPHTHLLEVEARLAYSSPAPASVELVMPVWTPGSYLVREYARHVQDFEAESGGRALAWGKADKNTWRVETAGARELRVTYKVYANEWTVRTNDLDDTHAVWNNAALLMYPAGHLAAPSTLRVQPFKDWKVATGLPQTTNNTFRAENFDVLYDSPFLVGNFRTLSFDVKGVAHRIVVDGEGDYDPERLRRDVRRIVETQVETMGGEVPYRDYTFILLLGATGGSGLEHSNSTLLTWRRFGFSTEADWHSLHTLVSHEFFHLWNVKRIRPEPLGPFDYTRENYTRLLWVAEGVTGYYENLLLRRAGLMTDKQLLDKLARSMQALRGVPGRLEMSVEEASFDAWIRYYRPDENSINASVSYYDKGEVLGAMLDLEIRKRSGNARSLDDVMRALYNDYFKRGHNYTPEDFQREAERAAGASLEEFFRRYVRGREELDYDSALSAAGLVISASADAQGRPAAEEAYLGATLAEDDGKLTVRNVPAGTPAYEQGLYAADQIVAVDGNRATLAFLNARVAAKRPGDTVSLAVFRADELRTLQIKLGSRSNGVFRIVPVREPSEQQRRVYQSWLGVPLQAGAGVR